MEEEESYRKRKSAGKESHVIHDCHYDVPVWLLKTSFVRIEEPYGVIPTPMRPDQRLTGRPAASLGSSLSKIALHLGFVRRPHRRSVPSKTITDSSLVHKELASLGVRRQISSSMGTHLWL
jgi:hypothetical protein